MHYEINVAKDGKHYFATAPHSLTDFKDAENLYKEFLVKFPPTEGFQLLLKHYHTTGEILAAN